MKVDIFLVFQGKCAKKVTLLLNLCELVGEIQVSIKFFLKQLL